MEYERCYIYKPSEPARKKRRLEPRGLHTSWPRRRELYQQDWQDLDHAFTEAIDAVTADTVTSLKTFLETEASTTDRLRCGIILLEPGSSSRVQLIQKVADDLAKTIQIVPLDPTSSSNLKNALKAINSNATRDTDAPLDFTAIDDADVDEDDSAPEVTPANTLRKTQGRRLLAYDLRILEEYTRSNAITSIVVHIEDTEGFSGEVLSSLVIQLSKWRDRIPLSILMNTSTSVDMLERRLTSMARKQLRCSLFQPATCRQEFQALMGVLKQKTERVVLGPTVLRLAAQRQVDYMHDIDCVRNECKYALMAAYFANPLTIFLGPKRDVSSDDYRALRATTSFKALIQRKLDERDAETARRLMTDDDTLYQEVSKSLRSSQDLEARQFREIFLWDTPMSHISTPRPRQAIERALTSPDDYLDCGDKVSEEISAALLWSLYKESGNMINVHDAWQAFLTRSELDSETLAMALFQRGLAEMKQMGFLKSTKLRVDHVAKASWPGL